MPPSISTGALLPARSSSARTVVDLVFAAGNKALAAEARVDRHDEDEVDVGGDLLERGHRRRRVEHDAGLRAERLDGVDRAMQMGQDFDVHRHHRRAGLDERVEVAIRIRDHQVDVERHVWRRA